MEKNRYRVLLEPLLKQLYTAMKEDGIITVSTGNDETSATSTPTSVESSREDKVPDEVTPELKEIIRSFNSFRDIAWQVYVKLGYSKSEAKIFDALKLFRDKEVIKFNETQNEELKSFLTNTSLLYHPRAVQTLYQFILDQTIDLTAESYNLLEFYFQQSLLSSNELFPDHNFQADGKIIYLNAKAWWRPNIVLTFKYSRAFTFSSASIQELAATLSFYNNETQKGNYLICLHFLEEIDHAISMRANYDFIDSIRAKFPDLINRIDYQFIHTKNLEIILQKTQAFIKEAEPYTEGIDYSFGKKVNYPDDIQRGRWGGQIRKRRLDFKSP